MTAFSLPQERVNVCRFIYNAERRKLILGGGRETKSWGKRTKSWRASSAQARKQCHGSITCPHTLEPTWAEQQGGTRAHTHTCAHARRLGSFASSQIAPSVGGIFLSSNNKRWNLGLVQHTKIAFNIHNADYVELCPVYNDHIVSRLFFFPQKYKRASCYRQHILLWSGTGRGFQWKVDLFQGIMGVQG